MTATPTEPVPIGRRRPVALVTGASSGIGETFARVLAGREWDLVLVARRVEPLERLAGEVAARPAAGSRTVEVLPADLTVAGELGAVEARLADPDRPVDLLVNNAGSTPRPGFLADQSADGLARAIELNVTALVRLTRAALPDMLARGDGAVLNVSSFGGFVPQPQGAVYAATKAFVTAFSESVYCEVGHRGVRVTAVCPGFTRRGDAAERGGTRRTRLPDCLWLEREDVVATALAAVAAGRAWSVPGRQYRAILGLIRALPRELVRRGFRRVWGRTAAPARPVPAADRTPAGGPR